MKKTTVQKIEKTSPNNNKNIIVGIVIFVLILIVGGIIMSKKNTPEDNTPKPFSDDTKTLIEMQSKEGPSSILKMNCDDYDKQGKDFCENMKKELSK